MRLLWVVLFEGIEKQFPEQEHFISFVSFNGLGIKHLHSVEPAGTLKEINSRNYMPDASTPLFDAMGSAINRLRESLDGQSNYNVLVTVLTDGEENASVEFSAFDIRMLVEKLKLEKWTFTYIGTDHDVEKIALSLSIDNTMVFEKNDAQINEMFKKEQYARTKFSEKIRTNEDTTLNYFDEPEKWKSWMKSVDRKFDDESLKGVRQTAKSIIYMSIY